MNRRPIWILSAMAAGVLVVAVLTVGASAGQFGFGAESNASSEPLSALQDQAASPDDANASLTTGRDDDDGGYYDDDDDRDDGEHESDHDGREDHDEEDD